MINIKTPHEIALIQTGGTLLSRVLKKVQQAVKPGISAYELDNLAEREILKFGAKPSFKNYKGYPATLCVSINDEIVHGIPTPEKILKAGDIVGLDTGLWYKNYCTDMAVTVPVGKVSKKAQKLLYATKNALSVGIEQARVGNTIGDIGYAVQSYAHKAGFGVVRDLVGHGVGAKVHEEPNVPNYGKQHSGIKLEVGMVLALEPMLTLGSYEVELQKDGWTFATIDGSLAAQFEHTIAITKNGPIILTEQN